MVGRAKYNKPLGRASGKALCWLSEVGVEWNCSSCKCIMKPGPAFEFGVPQTSTVPIPFHVKDRTPSQTTESSTKYFKKVFLCTGCALSFAEELNDVATFVSKSSVRALQTLEGM